MPEQNTNRALTEAAADEWKVLLLICWPDGVVA